MIRGLEKVPGRETAIYLVCGIYVLVYYYWLVKYSVNFPLNHDDGVHFLLHYGQYLQHKLCKMV